MNKPSHEAMKSLYYFILTNIYPQMSDEKKLEILAKSKQNISERKEVS